MLPLFLVLWGGGTGTPVVPAGELTIPGQFQAIDTRPLFASLDTTPLFQRVDTLPMLVMLDTTPILEEV